MEPAWTPGQHGLGPNKKPRLNQRDGVFGVQPRGLGDRRDIRGLFTFGALHDIELNLLAFFQRTKAACGDRREVGENVLSTFIGGDKPKTLSVVKPLDCTRRHQIFLL
jgi:hypothetical protein